MYVIDPSSVSVHENTVSATIVSDVEHVPILSKAAREMTLMVSFYQDGIARVSIDEVGGVEKRYKISDE